MIHQKQLLAGVDPTLVAALEDFHWGLSKWYNIQIWKGHFDEVHGNLLKSGKGVMFTVQRSGATIHAKTNKDIGEVIAWFEQTFEGLTIETLYREKFDIYLLKAKVTKAKKAKSEPTPQPETEWNALDATGLANEEAV